MLFTLAFITALVAGTPLTAPSPLPQKRDYSDLCGDSTFINQSSGGSPELGDCLELAEVAKQHEGPYQQDCWGSSDSHIIEQFGTCAWAIYCKNVNGITIGGEDIYDTIYSARDMFTWFDKVGAKGDMSCNDAPITWALWRV